MIQPFEMTVTVRNNWIKARRAALGLTQIGLGKATGVPIHWVAAFERLGADYLTSKIALGHAAKIAEFLQVSVAELFPPERHMVRQSRVVHQLSGAQVRRMAAVAARALIPESVETPEELAQQAERAALVRKSVASLSSPRAQAVIEARFGLNGEAPKSLEEIAVDFGVHRERIRQIEAKALRDLRHPKRTHKLKGAL